MHHCDDYTRWGARTHNPQKGKPCRYVHENGRKLPNGTFVPREEGELGKPKREEEESDAGDRKGGGERKEGDDRSTRK